MSAEVQRASRRSASMRPRHKAAEYQRELRARRQQVDRASMRPRHKAAEYGALANVVGCRGSGLQ